MTGHRFEGVVGTESGASRSAGMVIYDIRLETGRKCMNAASLGLAPRNLVYALNCSGCGSDNQYTGLGVFAGRSQG